MTTWVNFAEIREKVSLEDVLTRFYQIEGLKRDGRKLVGCCPVHNGDSSRAFHADLDKNSWFCFSRCRKGGNQLDLVAQKEGISVRDAALRLQAFFLHDASPPGVSTPKAPAPAAAAVPAKSAPAKDSAAPSASGKRPTSAGDEPATTNPPLDFTLELKGDHPHLVQDRALKAETIEHFGVGYCSRGILRGTIAIPIHDDDGDLVAYAGRRLKTADIRDKGKYALPKGFKKEHVLFNFHRAKPHFAEHGAILVEGFFSVLKLHEAGLPNVVASMGCILSDAQAELLRAAPDVVILYDGNEAGWTGAEAARAKLSASLPARIVRLPSGLEPEDLSPKALRWIVNGVRALDLGDLRFEFRTKTAP